METFIIDHWLDITTTLLGLAYILFEYRASVWLWPVGFVMQALGVVLYYEKGLYADCGMEFYYICMTCYGFYTWTRGHRGEAEQKSDKPITHFERRLILPWTLLTLTIWGVIYYLLAYHTDSRVPVADSVEYCGHLGPRAQVSGAMAHLDSGRCGHLWALLLQGHTLQGEPLRSLCSHSCGRLLQMEARDG